MGFVDEGYDAAGGRGRAAVIFALGELGMRLMGGWRGLGTLPVGCWLFVVRWESVLNVLARNVEHSLLCSQARVDLKV